jgi:hypothetical protein
MARQTKVFEIVQQPEVVVVLFLNVVMQIWDHACRNPVGGRKDLAAGDSGLHQRDGGSCDIIGTELMQREQSCDVGSFPESLVD